MLVYQAIGDAYGAPFEFVTKDRWPGPNTADKYYRHPDIPLGDGIYTDDTQMSLSVLETILGVSDREIKSLQVSDFTSGFYYTYRRDPRAGYSSGLTSLFENAASLADFQTKLGGNSTRSGAIMRSAVVGFLPDIKDVLYVSRVQCEATHNNSLSIQLSQAVSVATHYNLHGIGDRHNVFDYIEEHVGSKLQLDEPSNGWASVEAIDCARNAFDFWFNSRNATEILIKSVEAGGDTDTVASVAMGLAWGDRGLSDNLDLALTNGLETGTWGFPHLQGVSATAYKRFVK